MQSLNLVIEFNHIHGSFTQRTRITHETRKKLIVAHYGDFDFNPWYFTLHLNENFHFKITCLIILKLHA